MYSIAVAIEKRAAGIVAASIIGLLACAGELPAPETREIDSIKLNGTYELAVGYTGGCITGFQNYLHDCQTIMDTVIRMEYGDDTNIRVILSPCHDGGITGAGILVPASLKSERN